MPGIVYSENPSLRPGEKNADPVLLVEGADTLLEAQDISCKLGEAAPQAAVRALPL